MTPPPELPWESLLMSICKKHGISISATDDLFNFLRTEVADERKKWEAEILAGERKRTLRFVLEKIPKAHNPANALMDKYREGQNNGYKQVRTLLEHLLAPENTEDKIR